MSHCCVLGRFPVVLCCIGTLSGRGVVAPCGADLGAVQRHGREKDARAVEGDLPASVYEPV